MSVHEPSLSKDIVSKMRNCCCVVVAKLFMRFGWCWVHSCMELCSRSEKYYKFTFILLILCFCIPSVECCLIAGHVCIWAKLTQRDIARSMRNCWHDCCKNVHACSVTLGVVLHETLFWIREVSVHVFLLILCLWIRIWISWQLAERYRIAGHVWMWTKLIQGYYKGGDILLLHDCGQKYMHICPLLNPSKTISDRRYKPGGICNTFRALECFCFSEPPVLCKCTDI